MPSLVFPAPGSTSGAQATTPFYGLDVAPVTGGTNRNLLKHSQNIFHTDWTKTGATVGTSTKATYSSGGAIGAISFVALAAPGSTYIGYYITGTGVPDDTYITAINSTTIYLSKALTQQAAGTYNLYSPDGGYAVTTSATTNSMGQTLSVTANTQYTVSFYAKAGTATEVTYGVYNNTGASNIVAPTNYYSTLTSTSNNYSQISVINTSASANVSLTVPFLNSYSCSFGGSNTIYSSVDFSQTGNFTLEGWFYFTGTGQNTIANIGNEATGRIAFYHNGTGGALSYNIFGSGAVSLTATTVANNTWTHIAIIRNSTNLTTYVNGQGGSPVTLSGTIGNASGIYIMGINNAGTIAGQGTGFVSNYRLVSGTAVYTANFNPAYINLTNITNTKLLACQDSSPIKDNSSNNYTLTNFGSVSTINGNIPIYVGMAVTGTNIAASSYVYAISGPTVTLNNTTTAAVNAVATFFDNRYQRISFTFTTPAGCTSITVYPIWTTTAGTGSTYINAVQIEQGSTANTYQVTLSTSYAASGYTAYTPISTRSVVPGKVVSFGKIASVVDNRRLNYSLPKSLETIRSVPQTRPVPPLMTKFTVNANTIAAMSNESYVLDHATLQKQLAQLRTLNQEGIYLDNGNVIKFTVPNNKIGSLPNEFYVLDHANLQKQLEVIRFPSDNRRLSSTITKFTTPYNKTQVFFRDTTVQRVEANYAQSSVVVTGAPTNARENLYYFNLAPGKRSNKSITQGLTYATVVDNRSSTQRIEANYAQSSVVVTGAPTNARENLYYFNLAPGKRNNKSITIGLTYAGMANEAYALDHANIDNTYLQSTVKPTSAPTTPRENLYYVNLAPGKLVNKSIAQGLTYAGMANEAYALDHANIDNTYLQSTVKPTGAPVTARENLYYFNLAPGLRSNKSITQGLTYAGMANEAYVLDHAKLSSVTQLRTLNQEGIYLDNGKVTSTAQLRSLNQEGIYLDNGNILKLRLPYYNTEVFDSPTSSLLQKQMIQVQSLNQDNVYLDNGNINVYYNQNTVRPTYPPYAPRDNYYFSTIGYGIRVGKSAVYGGDPGSQLVQTFDSPTSSTIQRQIAQIKGLPNVGVVFDNGKVTSTARLTAIPNELRYLSTLKLGSTAQLRNPTPADSYVFDTNSIDKFRVSYTTTEVFDSPTSSTIQRQIALLKGMTNEAYVLDHATVQRQIALLRGLPNVGIIFDNGKVTSTAQLRSFNQDGYYLDVNNIDKFRVSYTTTEVFDSPTSSTIQRQIAQIKGLPNVGIIFDNGKVTSTARLTAIPNEFRYLRTYNVEKQTAKLTAIPNELRYLSTLKLESTAQLRNPTPADSYVFDPNMINILKLSAQRTQLFDSPTSSNLEKQISKLTTIQNYLSTLKLDSTSQLRSYNNATTPFIITIPLTKYAVSRFNNQTFYAPVNDKLTITSVLRALRTDSQFVSGSIRPQTRVSYFDIQGGVNWLSDFYAQSSVVVTGEPTNPRENLYYFNLAPGLRSNKSITQGLTYASMANEAYALDHATLQKQVSLLTAIPNEKSYLNTAKVTSTAQLRTLNNELRYLSTYNIQRQVQQIKSAPEVKSTYNIDNFYAQSNVVVTGAPTNPRENLYYFNLAPGKRSNKSITQGLNYGQVGGDKPTISTLKAGIPLVKGLTRLEEILSDVNFITQFRKSVVNATILIPVEFTEPSIASIKASVIVRSTVDVGQVLQEYRFKMSADTVQVLDTPAGTEYITKLKVGGSIQGTGVTDPNPVSRSSQQAPIQFWN